MNKEDKSKDTATEQQLHATEPLSEQPARSRRSSAAHKSAPENTPTTNPVPSNSASNDASVDADVTASDSVQTPTIINDSGTKDSDIEDSSSKNSDQTSDKIAEPPVNNSADTHNLNPSRSPDYLKEGDTPPSTVEPPAQSTTTSDQPTSVPSNRWRKSDHSLSTSPSDSAEEAPRATTRKITTDNATSYGSSIVSRRTERVGEDVRASRPYLPRSADYDGEYHRDESGDRRYRGYRTRNRVYYRHKVDKIRLHNLEINYKRPDILQRFITERGKILPRRVTGTSAKNQRRLVREIKRARILALLPMG